MKHIHAPIAPLRSSSSPDHLCSAAGHSCNAVSQSRFSFRNKQDTGWERKRSGPFKSKDKNFARIVNDKSKRILPITVREYIQELRARKVVKSAPINVGNLM